jgi:uncharacterized repeat protein (TIGR03837 family)
MIKIQKKWDVFCKVVDNYGDIGVCWRLVKQLHHEHGLQVRLFVDNLPIAAKLLIGISDVAEQLCEGIAIIRWDDDTAFESAADVVIETFACDLPDAYLVKMDSNVIWVNVDYLSAESWVPEFHSLHGKHQDSNLKRHFYFPGFDEHTGGLLREKDLIVRRDAFQQSEDLQHQFWKPLGVDTNVNDLKLSLFSYSNAPINALLQSLAEAEKPVSVFMPVNSSLPMRLLGHDSMAVGDCITEGALTLYVLPFLSQDDYDKLLWACDINFVRGEDSWVRALWAGKPFIWQPYLQTDNAHLLKLNAFIKKFYDEHEVNQTIAKLHEAWSIEVFPDDVWQHYLASLVEIKAHTQRQCKEVIRQEPLATRLVAFCANLAK